MFKYIYIEPTQPYLTTKTALEEKIKIGTNHRTVIDHPEKNDFRWKYYTDILATATSQTEVYVGHPNAFFDREGRPLDIVYESKVRGIKLHVDGIHCQSYTNEWYNACEKIMIRSNMSNTDVTNKRLGYIRLSKKEKFLSKKIEHYKKELYNVGCSSIYIDLGNEDLENRSNLISMFNNMITGDLLIVPYIGMVYSRQEDVKKINSVLTAKSVVMEFLHV